MFKNENAIYFKVHPKQQFNYNFLNEKKYIKGRLEDKIKNFNLFIIDMISQPFFSIARTNLKILYLNFNHRKIREDVLRLIKKRAYVFNIDLKNINEKKINFALKKAYNFRILSKEVVKL